MFFEPARGGQWCNWTGNTDGSHYAPPFNPNDLEKPINLAGWRWFRVFVCAALTPVSIRASSSRTGRRWWASAGVSYTGDRLSSRIIFSIRCLDTGSDGRLVRLESARRSSCAPAAIGDSWACLNELWSGAGCRLHFGLSSSIGRSIRRYIALFGCGDGP